MSIVTLQVATDLVAGVLDAGKAMGLQPLSVVVVDAGGFPIAFARQDGASAGRFQLAMGKATGALFLGVSSRKIAEMAADRPTFVASLGSIAREGVVPAAGGLVIADGHGRTIGAIGVTGDTSDNDETCALAALKALGLAALP